MHFVCIFVWIRVVGSLSTFQICAVSLTIWGGSRMCLFSLKIIVMEVALTMRPYTQCWENLRIGLVRSVMLSKAWRKNWFLVYGTRYQYNYWCPNPLLFFVFLIQNNYVHVDACECMNLHACVHVFVCGSHARKFQSFPHLLILKCPPMFLTVQ